MMYPHIRVTYCGSKRPSMVTCVVCGECLLRTPVGGAVSAHSRRMLGREHGKRCLRRYEQQVEAAWHRKNDAWHRVMRHTGPDAPMVRVVVKQAGVAYRALVYIGKKNPAKAYHPYESEAKKWAERTATRLMSSARTEAV